jgi:chitinase
MAPIIQGTYMNKALPLARRAPLLASLLAVLASSTAAASSPSQIPLPSTTSFTDDARGHFLDKDILRALPGAARSTLIRSSPVLAGVANFGAVTMERAGTYEIRSASTPTADGSLIIVESDDGGFVALVDTPDRQGTVVGASDGSQIFIEAPENDYMQPDTEPGPESAALQTRAADTDGSGVNVIDLLAGFSQSAADRVKDPKAYALAQVESVNLRLRNSQVANARLRLVGIQVIEENFPTSNGKNGTLGRVSKLFAEGMKEYGADLVAAFSNAPSGNTAGGWGFVPGRYSVQQVRSPAAFRHEVAHNVGGSHCNTGQNSYKFGYGNGKSSTSLCGNKVAYYSTPLLSDQHGLPLGDSAKADMARLWREQAAKMSSHAKPVVPIDG